jgi:hypothetical protein
MGSSALRLSRHSIDVTGAGASLAVHTMQVISRTEPIAANALAQDIAFMAFPQ